MSISMVISGGKRTMNDANLLQIMESNVNNVINKSDCYLELGIVHKNLELFQ